MGVLQVVASMGSHLLMDLLMILTQTLMVYLRTIHAWHTNVPWCTLVENCCPSRHMIWFLCQNAQGLPLILTHMDVQSHQRQLVKLRLRVKDNPHTDCQPGQWCRKRGWSRQSWREQNGGSALLPRPGMAPKGGGSPPRLTSPPPVATPLAEASLAM